MWALLDQVKTDNIEIPTISRSLKVLEGNDVQQASAELVAFKRRGKNYLGENYE